MHTQQHNFRRVAGVNQVLFAFFRVIPGSLWGLGAKLRKVVGNNRVFMRGRGGTLMGTRYAPLACSTIPMTSLGITRDRDYPPRCTSSPNSTLCNTYPQACTNALPPCNYREVGEFSTVFHPLSTPVITTFPPCGKLLWKTSIACALSG